MSFGFFWSTASVASWKHRRATAVLRCAVICSRPAFAASQQAIREYDLFETKSKLNTYDGELYARSRKDDKVFISIAEMNSKQTLLRIRWSTTGDKKNSKALYDLIEKNLRGGH